MTILNLRLTDLFNKAVCVGDIVVGLSSNPGSGTGLGFSVAHSETAF